MNTVSYVADCLIIALSKREEPAGRVLISQLQHLFGGRPTHGALALLQMQLELHRHAFSELEDGSFLVINLKKLDKIADLVFPEKPSLRTTEGD